MKEGKRIELTIPKGIAVKKIDAKIGFISQKTGQTIMTIAHKMYERGINFYTIQNYPHNFNPLRNFSLHGFDFSLIQRTK